MQKKDTGIVTGTNYNTNPGQWVANYADYLYSYAIVRISNEDVARDLVQETFLSALEGLHRFEGRSTERTWLTAILKNKIIDIYRKKNTRLNGEKNEAATDDFFDDGDGHWKEKHRPQEFAGPADDPVLAKEFNMTLKQCMDKLPGLWLTVFSLKHLDELDSAAICREMKLTAANFWVIIHRAKVNLRACLEKKWI